MLCVCVCDTCVHVSIYTCVYYTHILVHVEARGQCQGFSLITLHLIFFLTWGLSVYLDLIGSATRAFQWTPGACTHYYIGLFLLFSLSLCLCLSFSLSPSLYVSTEGLNSILNSKNFYWLSHLLLSPWNNDSFLTVAEYLGEGCRPQPWAQNIGRPSADHGMTLLHNAWRGTSSCKGRGQRLAKATGQENQWTCALHLHAFSCLPVDNIDQIRPPGWNQTHSEGTKILCSKECYYRM